MTVHCRACNHTWDVPMKLPMPIMRAVKAMKGAVAGGCPKCGAHGPNVICGPAPAEAPPASADALDPQAADPGTLTTREET